jgi:hypothetical protein
MRRIVFALVAVATLAGTAGYMAPASGQADAKGISPASTKWPTSNTTFALSNFTGMSM